MTLVILAVCRMPVTGNLVNRPCWPWVSLPVVQWLESMTSVWEFVGSISFGDSDIFVLQLWQTEYSIFPNIISFLTSDITLVTSLSLCRRLNFNERTMSVSACETRGGTLWVLGWGCGTQKSKIVYNLEYLAWTVKCLDCGLRFGRFFVSVLARGIQISKKKMQARQWIQLGSRIPVHMSLHSFPFLISKPNYSFFEGAHFDFQAESIWMQDNCLPRLGSKQLLKVRAEF